MKILKQNVGVDIAKDSFVSSFTVLTESQDIEFKSTKTFANNLKGFCDQMSWVEKLKDANVKLSFTMEGHRSLL